MKKLILAVLGTLLLTACPPTAEKGRDTAAALKGYITTAQAQHQAECQANPSATVCQAINRGVSAQNALITAIQSYCGWMASTPPSDTTAACVPVKSAEQGLNVAIANANQEIKEVKGVIR